MPPRNRLPTRAALPPTPAELAQDARSAPPPDARSLADFRPPADTLDAAAAAAALGVSRDTLYAYVSRGLLRSAPDPADPRARRYAAEDVARLRAQRATRQGRPDPAPGVRAVSALGEIVLESAITLIQHGRLYYRGQDVVALAGTRSFEDVAELLWLGTLPADTPVPRRAVAPGNASVTAPVTAARAGDALAARLVARVGEVAGVDLPPMEWMQAALPLEAARDLAALDLRPAGVAATGRRILAIFGAVVDPASEVAPLAHRLARAWAPAVPGAARLLDATLVLVADHGLNAAALTARCAASAGASPHRALAAGLAALQGAKHGGDVGRVHRLLAAVAEGGDPLGVLADYLARGERIPGFRHALYADGDPRAAALLALTGELLPDAPVTAVARRLCDAAAAATGDRPVIDLALAVVAEAIGAPAHAPRTLFALGRTAGLLAHAMEQYGSGTPIQPRAEYVGVAPPAGAPR